MKYRTYGKTGEKVSALGFGCMRLPMLDDTTVDREKAVPMLLKAYELGVNYFDTGKFYCNGDSEKTLGEAVQQMDRSRILVSTKYPMETPSPEDMRSKLEYSLKQLQLDYVDFYHLWGISWQQFHEKIDAAGGPLSTFITLKEEGLVRHLSFSFHGAPGDIRKLVDTGVFETMLCQYNLLDRSNEEDIAYAAEKGLGIAVMGPVGGGRLGGVSQTLAAMLKDGTPVSSPELALRYVLAHPEISLALSGMSAMQHVLENCATAARDVYLEEKDLANIGRAQQENRRMEELYCTGCKYCMPCPHGVNIPRIFEAMNYRNVWDLEEHAKNMYAEIGNVDWVKGSRADVCTQCGECEEKCPQGIPIISQLEEAHNVLSAG